METLLKTTLYAGLLLAASHNMAYAEQHDSRPISAQTTSLSQAISKISPRHSQIALLAMDMSNNQVIYSQQAETLFIPASTQKLLTAVSAVAQLGPDFRYVTQLWTDAPIRKGHIAGSAYLRFSGDPTLTQADLKAIFANLVKQGINRIDGHLYLLGDKQEQMQAPGWVWDDLGICFAAPVSSYIINQNCVYGQFSPSSTSKPSQVSLRAGSYGVKISSDAVFDQKASREFCQLDIVRLGQNNYHLRGCYPGGEAIPLAIAVSDPFKFAQDNLTSLLKGEMSLAGKVQLGTNLPQKAKLIASHSSAPLPELLETMLLKSDNLIADSLFKQLGKSYFKTQGSFTNGAVAMQRILTNLGIDLSNANIVDGSGLSRYNLLNAKQLAAVLALIHQDSRFSPLITSLPQAGISGTLRYRMGYNKPPLKQQIFAKTGSMQGVSNLAGFIRLPQHNDTLFVILENGMSPELKNQHNPSFNAEFLKQLISVLQPSSTTATVNTAAH